MFSKIKEAYARARAEREQREREEKERRERELQAEKERLMALSEKELLVELLIELKRIDSSCDDIKDKCYDIELAFNNISSNVRLYGN